MNRSKILLCITTLVCVSCLPLHAASPKDAQALHVRRIIELWKAQEFDVAQRQIHEFLKEHPDSPYLDRLMVIAGDYEWRLGHYAEALSYYDKIQSQEFLDSSFDHRIDSLYHAGQYERLVGALQDRLPAAITNDSQAVRAFQFAEGLAQLGRHQEALKYYESVKETKLATHAKLGMAGSYVTLEQPIQAVPLFLELADMLPEKREALLLRAAQLQMGYDPAAASNTLALLRGQQSSAGAFSQLFLLFQANNHEEIWNFREQFKLSVPSSQQPMLDFFIGRSAFATGHYQEAINYLLPLLTLKTDDTDSTNEKILLTTLIVSAQQLKKADLARQWLGSYEKSFPKDPTLGRLWLAQAQLLASLDSHPKAMEYLDRVLAHPVSANDRESAAYLRVTMLYDQGRWKECHERAREFVVIYPNGEYLSWVKKAMARATSAQLETGTMATEERNLLQSRFVTEIQELLKQERLLTAQEKGTYLLQLAKVQYARQNYQDAIVTASEFIQSFPRDKQMHKAYLVMAYASYEQEDYATFVAYAEKALSLRPDMTEADGVRLNLFTAYLKLASANGDAIDGDAENVVHAANHLYGVYADGKTTLKPEHLVWLARYYYVNVRRDEDELQIEPLHSSKRREQAERSLKILLAANAAGDLNKLDDIVMLSHLYGWLGLINERQALLTEALKQSWPNDSKSRKQRQQMHLALAQLNLDAGKNSVAMDLCVGLTNQADCDPYVRDVAHLQLARVRIKSGDVEQVLGDLQTLQSRRLLAHEPVHLEAAWERAHVAAQVAPDPSYDEKLLALLRQAKRDIVAQDDIVSQDYHISRESNVSKDRVYQAYLMLFDARIAQVEGRLAGERKRVSDQRSKEQVAKTLYGTLTEGNFAVSKFLVAQAKEGLKQIP
ncbi:MAG: tetratricopeptide repeat protein [Chlamydiales bacterium]|nr:tetratricopeptide repeat protein [Chlamydiales bacterium]